jgi:hopanoid biosynthesis associated RND transporter like protein HpnN
MARRFSLRIRLLEALAHGTYHHPWLFLAAGALAAAVALGATSAWLAIKTSRDDLISPNQEYVRIYKGYQAEFGDRDDLVIVVDDPDLRRAKRFVREVASRLESDPAAAREVLYRIDPDAFDGKALMFLSPQELVSMRAKLGEHIDVIDRIAADPSLAGLLRAINREISAAFVGHLVASFLGTEDGEDDEEEAPLDLSLLQTLVDSLGLAATGQPYGSIWRSFLRPGSDLDEDGYLVDEDRRFVFILVQAEDDATVMAGAEEAIERVRGHIAAVWPAYPGLEVGITGGPALAAEEMAASVRDTSLASVLSLLGVGLCFVLFYRDVARPLLAVLTLALGLAWSFGWITVSVGHLTILSVAFATILIGMSDDFGVHLISRFEEETLHGQRTEEALRRTFVNSGGAIIAGAVTFAVAFFAMAFTDFIGMAELGIIGGGGVLLCLIAMLTVFPAGLVLYEQLKQRPVGRWIDTHVRLPERLAGWEAESIDRIYRRPWLLLAFSAALTVVSAFGLRHVGFDTNLLNLQAVGTESVDWELKIIEQGRSSRYAVSVADSLEEARRLEAAYEALPVVRRVESAASLIPERQPERIAAIDALAPLVAELPPIEAPSEEVDPGEVHELLESIRFKLQDDPDRQWDPERKPDEKALDRIRASLARVEPLVGGDPVALRPPLLALQRDVFLDFADQIEFLRDNLRPGPISLETLPELLRTRFVGQTGKLSVQVFPEKNTWDPENLREFVAELRAVDPRVTGGPVSFHETSLRMRDGYIDAGLYALIAICLLVLWDFRSVRLAALALVPLGVGALWTVGVMWIFGLDFNLANLIILPLIVGIGISNGIHIIHRHLEDGSGEMSVIARSTGKGVVLSSLTTMVGFGALMVAQHQGIFSLGLLLTIGIGCNLLASLTVLPAILALVGGEGERGQQGQQGHQGQ